MKKGAMIIFVVVMATLISGCAINADAEVDVTYPSLNLDELSDSDDSDPDPYEFRVEEEKELLEEPSIVEEQASEVVSGGASWIYSKVQDGERGVKTKKYELTYNRNGELLSRKEIPGSEVIEETKPTIYRGGQKAQPGAYFESQRITRYGVDCVGCKMNSKGVGGTSAGIPISLDSVRQKDGTWKKGITYEGYYIVATSSSIPLCSIIEISDHTVSGMGITPGVPFQAIVLDRGGAIQGSKLDLFVGREDNMPVTQGRRQNAKVKIISLNSRTRDANGFNCSI